VPGRASSPTWRGDSGLYDSVIGCSGWGMVTFYALMAFYRRALSFLWVPLSLLISSCYCRRAYVRLVVVAAQAESPELAQARGLVESLFPQLVPVQRPARTVSAHDLLSSNPNPVLPRGRRSDAVLQVGTGDSEFDALTRLAELHLGAQRRQPGTQGTDPALAAHSHSDVAVRRRRCLYSAPSSEFDPGASYGEHDLAFDFGHVRQLSRDGAGQLRPFAEIDRIVDLMEAVAGPVARTASTWQQ